ncbi:MAG: HAMP domain-containing histidine kinase [Candidatus Galacturonibacter soehngenii]|nr:HAMP domain-containing histidine kinase [Candidatus Galacturonibacter soehngenii]
MKGLIKILSRYVISATAVAIFLLVINFILLVAITVKSGSTTLKKESVQELTKNLIKVDDEYRLPDDFTTTLIQNDQWAMLLNEEGSVVWSLNLPSDISLQYSLSQVAGFSRWYLNDYPVYVWQHSDGLFVWGHPRHSVWKYSVSIPQQFMNRSPFYTISLFVANVIAALVLALLLGLRLFRSLKLLTKGIYQLTQKQPVTLSTQGLLGDVAKVINQTSEKLITQEEALSKRDSARTTWIAGISHDIRTPLSIAMGYSSQLENDLELTLAKREQAETIRKQCELIKTLVNDLNLASKLEYDMQPFHFEVILLAPFLRNIAVDFLNSKSSDLHSLDVCIDETAQNISANADRVLLSRAVSNLITNSVRHNKDGCHIHLSLKCDSFNCSIEVADNGIGFTKEMLHTLNHEKASVELNTHGLGLTLVRQIIKAHKGYTSFQNQLEGGCMITLCLPLHESSHL